MFDFEAALNVLQVKGLYSVFGNFMQQVCGCQKMVSQTISYVMTKNEHIMYLAMVTSVHRFETLHSCYMHTEDVHVTFCEQKFV